MAAETVAIIGLGLMGGSLARDLAARGVRTIGYDADAAALAAALAAGALEHALDASLDGIDEADVVVLAVPVDAAAELLVRTTPCLRRASLITDVGSTKAGIVRAAVAAGVGDRFVGAHPLAGDERAGFDSSRTGLFAGARVFLCPTDVTRPDALRAAQRFWEGVGAHAEIVEAHAHDRALAWTSHLPQALATALAIALADAGITRGELGAGGRAMTRLAASSPEMWAAIAAENRHALREAIERVDAVLHGLHAAMRDPSPDTLRAFFAMGRSWASGAAGAAIGKAAAIEPGGAAAAAPRDAVSGSAAATASAAGVAPEAAAHGSAAATAIGAGMAPEPAAHGGEAAGGERGAGVVAFQGELGAFGEGAVHTFFRAPVRPLPCRTFGDVADAVLAGDAAYGMLPVENSSAGSVVAAYDVLARSGLAVIGEVVQPIRHALLGVRGAALGRVRRVLSHPVALAQCSAFFAGHRWLDAVAFYDTAGAAREVADAGDPSLAAIASADAAERYGLDVLARDVHDREDNRTRFLAIARAEAGAAFRRDATDADAGDGRDPAPARMPGATDAHDGEAAERRDPSYGHSSARVRTDARMKSTLLLDTADTPGSLARALACFARRGVNLAHIQSTPGDTPWTYRFIVELDADAAAGEARAAIDEVRANGAELRVLGSYRVG